MNAFLTAACALMFGFVPLLWVCIREGEIDGVAALELCGALATLVLICLAEGSHRGIYAGVAVVCAALTWVTGYIFVRFLSEPG